MPGLPQTIVLPAPAKEGFADPLGQNLRRHWAVVTALVDHNLGTLWTQAAHEPESCGHLSSVHPFWFHVLGGLPDSEHLLGLLSLSAGPPEGLVPHFSLGK